VRQFQGRSPPHSRHHDKHRNARQYGRPYTNDKGLLPERPDRIDPRDFGIARQVQDAGPLAASEDRGRYGNVHFATGPDVASGRVQARIRFSDISTDRFLWASESSIDGGATWTRTASLVASGTQAESSE